MPDARPRATLSVAIITFNEEENIRRTLASVKDIADEIVIVDSGSTDDTVRIAQEFEAKVFIEEWKGFAGQKNSALDKCASDWILCLDADEEISLEMAECLSTIRSSNADSPFAGFVFNRQNYFLNKPLRYGGQIERKLRLFRRGQARVKNVAVHEIAELSGPAAVADRCADRAMIRHYAYPTLNSYVEHMNRYSSLGAEIVVQKRGRVGFNLINIVLRPLATFLYNYFFRLGFLDGKEGLLLHLYHSAYVSWKYAKAWELSRANKKP